MWIFGDRFGMKGEGFTESMDMRVLIQHSTEQGL